MPLCSQSRPERTPPTRLIGLATVLLAALPHFGSVAAGAEAQRPPRVKRAKRAASRMDSAFIEAGRLYTGRKYEQALEDSGRIRVDSGDTIHNCRA